MLRLFTREGRENRKLPPGLADAIFQEDPLRTRELLIERKLLGPGVQVRDFVESLADYRDTRLKVDTQRRRGVIHAQINDMAELTDAKKRDKRAEEEIVLLRDEGARRDRVGIISTWEPSYMPPPDDSTEKHTYWLTALARTAMARLILELTPRDSKVDGIIQEKTARWLNRHVPMLRYLDEGIYDNKPESYGIPYTDVNVDVFRFADSYVPLGTTSYPDDQEHIEQTVTYIPRKRRPQPDAVLHTTSDCTFTLPNLREQANWVCVLLRNEGPPPDEIDMSRWELVTWLVDGTHVREGELSYFDDMRLPWLQCHKFVDDLQHLLDHSIWISMLLNLRVLGDIRADVKSKVWGQRDRDAAYMWQLAHLELADICEKAGRFDDEFLLTVDPKAKLSPLEAYYPYPGRAFHEGNLPDLTSVMELIALYGEKYLPDFDIAQLFGKSVKCACMRRHLTNVTMQSARGSASFWKVFSKLMLCMLWGTYERSENRLHGDTALAMMRMCRDQDELSAALKKQPYKSCLIIFIAVRMYMVFYGNLNTPYAAAADKVIYWFELQEDTRAMANLVRGTNLLADDVFAEARIYLKRHCKNNQALVYRYRAGCLAKNLFNTCCDALEKGMWMELEYQRRDIATMEQMTKVLRAGQDPREYTHMWEACCKLVRYGDMIRGMTVEMAAHEPSAALELLLRAIECAKATVAEFSRELDRDVKSNILNMLLVIPKQLRYAPETFTILCKEEYGGLDSTTVACLVQLVRNYFECKAPKESQEQLANFSPHDLRVSTWYFHCCKMYERIRLVRLDAVTQQHIEDAMKTHRHQLYPGVQALRDEDFIVYVTICCNRVASEMDGSYGHNDVRYDMGTNTVVCKRGTKQKDVLAVKAYAKPISFPLLAVSENEMKHRATARKNQHLRVSCPQPALPICIRGYRLMLGLSRDNIKSYQHCPRCGSPTQVHLSGYLGVDGYMCSYCLRKDKSQGRTWSCAYCNEAVHPEYVRDPDNDRRSHWKEPKTCVTVMRAEEVGDGFVDNPASLLQDIYLCKPHYRVAAALLKLRPRDKSRGKQPRWMNKQTLFRLLGEAHMRNELMNLDIKFAKRGIARDK